MLHRRSSTFFRVSLVVCVYAWTIVPAENVRDLEQVCARNQSPLVNEDNLVLCYVNHVQDRYIDIWFTIGEFFNSTFSEFRFVIFSTESELLHSERVEYTSNFSNLSDPQENLRFEEPQEGQYKACVDFRTAQSDLIYEPRDACLLIQIGEISHRSFDQSAAAIMVVLVVAIVIFFVLGLIIPPVKKRRDARRKLEETESNDSSSTSALKRRQRLANRLFRRHVENGPRARAHEWARTRVGRHMVAPDEDEIILQQLAPVIKNGLHNMLTGMVPSRDVLRQQITPVRPSIRFSTNAEGSDDIELIPKPSSRSRRIPQQTSYTAYDMTDSEQF